MSIGWGAMLVAFVVLPNIAVAAPTTEGASNIGVTQAEACGDLVSAVLCAGWNLVLGALSFTQKEAAWAQATAGHVLGGG